jgi:hypothetical protein
LKFPLNPGLGDDWALEKAQVTASMIATSGNCSAADSFMQLTIFIVSNTVETSVICIKFDVNNRFTVKYL